MDSIEGLFMKLTSSMSVLICLVTSAVLSAQSLGEIAEREKKRREKLPPTKVIRDEDLTSSGGAVSEMGTDSESPITPPPAPLASDEEESESDWPSVFADCRTRYDAAKALRDQKLDLIVTGLPIGTDLERIPCSVIMSREFMPGWIQYSFDCERLEKEASEHEAEMRAIQDECLNEARIRSIPPGEARLD
jgi:hypothetical protein